MPEPPHHVPALPPGAVAPSQAQDLLPCAWARLDAAGHMLAVNTALCRLVGDTPAGLCGRPFDSLLTRGARVLYQSYLQPLLRLHGQVEELALVLQGPGGVPVDVLVYSAKVGNGMTMPGSAGDIELVIAPIRQRRRIEDEMLRIKRAADHAPGMIFQLLQMPDDSFHFPYASEAIWHLYGVSAAQASQAASAVLRHIDADDHRALALALRAAATAGQDWRGQYRVRLPGHTLRWHEMQATPRQLANGVTLWHGHAADVTERREMEAALADKQTAVQMHRARSEFLARVSHELRTPLNAILGFAQLLATDRADNLQPVQRDRLGLIRSAGQHLLGLVEEVLEVTSIEAGQQLVALSPLWLLPQVDLALGLVAPQAQAAGVRLLPAQGLDGVSVLANAQRLQQVLVNLLSNAIKYNWRGGWVRLTAALLVPDGVAGPATSLATHQTVQLQVQDSGPGLTDAQRAALFQPFNRLGAEHGPVPGNGLGLVISRHLMTLMGGGIRVLSPPGAGCCFAVTLPDGGLHPAAALEAAPPADPAADPPPHPAGLGAAPLPARPARPLRGANGAVVRVLYVEDNEINAILMDAIVGMLPQVRLQVVPSAAAALAEVQARPPDLLLVDMHLPDADGIELLQLLRRIDGMASVPAVVVSAGALADDIARARQHGFVDYWTKPLDVDRTLKALLTLLRSQTPASAEAD